MKSLIEQLYYLNDTTLKTHEKSFKELSKEMNSLLFDEIRQCLPQEQKKLVLRAKKYMVQCFPWNQKRHFAEVSAQR